MSRIVGSYAGEAAQAEITVRRLMSLAAGQHSTQKTTIAIGRCHLGWMGWDAANIAKIGSVVAVVDGRFYNRKEIDRTTGLNNTLSNDATRLATLYQYKGLDIALTAINGDFAAAVYDKHIDTLWLARDRLGVKPLYYTEYDGQLAFASRPGPLIHLEGVSREVNRRFVANYAGGHYRHVDNVFDESPFKNVRQLPPASVLKSHNGICAVYRYWDLKEQPDYVESEHELAEQYRELLLDAVRCRIDVTDASAFTLSGGLDSSSILSCTAALTANRQHAFSAVYVDPTYDETTEIKPMLESKVAEWHPVRVGTPDVIGIVRRMVTAHDQPVATATWLSHFMLCDEVSRNNFKTIFGGLGGDELNAGEYEYFYFLFADLRRAGAERELRNEIEEWVRHHDHPIFRKSRAVAEEYLSQVVDFENPGLCRVDTRRMTRYHAAVDRAYFDLSAEYHIMDQPFTSYLKNRTYQDIFRETTPCCLRAEDRQVEAFGLQQIDPFLDHRVVEFMFRVPGKMKIRDGITKRLLREAMHGILPEETRTRVKKTGWNAPAHIWFGKGPVADDLRDLVASVSFRQRGIYDVKEVDRLIDEHHKIVANGTVLESHMMFLWQLINLEMWFEEIIVR